MKNSNARPAEAGTPNAPQFPAGTVVATVLTDEQGKFKFPNVKPGVAAQTHILFGESLDSLRRLAIVRQCSQAIPNLTDAEVRSLAEVLSKLML